MCVGGCTPYTITWHNGTMSLCRVTCVMNQLWSRKGAASPLVPRDTMHYMVSSLTRSRATLSFSVQEAVWVCYVLVACVRVCVCVYICMYTCVFKLPCRPVLWMSWQHHSTVINVSGSSEDQEIWRDTSAWAEAGRKETQNQHKSSVKCIQGFSDGKVTWKDTSAGQLNENIFSVLILLTSGTASSRLTAVFKVQGSRCVPRYVVYECHYSW